MSYLGAGLGAAAVVDPRIEFQTKYTALEFQVQLAFQQMLAKNPPAGVVTTMSNNIQSMQRLAQRALAGETAKMVDVSRVGEAIISEVRAYGASNIPTMEDLVRAIATIPAVFNAAVQKAAAATGKAVSTVAREAGVDPALLVAEAGGVLKWGAAAAVALAAVYLIGGGRGR